MGEPPRGEGLGGREVVGERGLSGRRKLRKKRDRFREVGRQRETRRIGKRETQRLRTEVGEGRIWGRQ